MKTVGNMLKFKVIKINQNDLDDILMVADLEDWPIEDVIDEWSILNDTALFPYYMFPNEFKLVDFDKYLIEYKGQFLLPVREVAKKEAEQLQRSIELTGIGRVLIPFSLKFHDFDIFLREPDDFFNLDDKSFIYNSLVLVDEPDSGLKLTGRAAEIQRRKNEKNNQDSL